jgi:hypothetical protein
MLKTPGIIPDRGTSISRLAVNLAQCHVHWFMGALFLYVNWLSMELTNLCGASFNNSWSFEILLHGMVHGTGTAFQIHKCIEKVLNHM